MPAHHRHFPDTMRLANFCCGDECCQVVPQPRHQRQGSACTEILLGLAGKDLMRMSPSRVHQRARTRTHTLSLRLSLTHTRHGDADIKTCKYLYAYASSHKQTHLVDDGHVIKKNFEVHAVEIRKSLYDRISRLQGWECDRHARQ